MMNQPNTGIIGQDPAANFKNDLLARNNSGDSGNQRGVRIFNIACIVIFLLSAIFTMTFLGDLETAQIVFYFIFVAFGLSNAIFYGCSSST
jgi:hypothetical protein